MSQSVIDIRDLVFAKIKGQLLWPPAKIESVREHKNKMKTFNVILFGTKQKAHLKWMIYFTLMN